MRAASLFVVLAAGVAVAAEPPSTWKFRAEVSAPEGRFVALPLGPDVFDLCARDDCSDLRMRDPDGREVPYALVFEGASPSTTAVAARMTSYATVGSASTAEFDFGRRYLSMQRAQLQLSGGPRRLFRKSCLVWGRNTLTHVERVRFETGELGPERRVETQWKVVGRSMIYMGADGKESLEIADQIPFRFVRIRIENGDSPPLALESLEGYAVPAFAVFEPAGQSRFALLAGNPEAGRPHFDAADTLARLDSHVLPKGEHAALTEINQGKPAVNPQGQTAVWLLLGGAALATAGLLWKTARSVADR